MALSRAYTSTKAADVEKLFKMTVCTAQKLYASHGLLYVF